MKIGYVALCTDSIQIFPVTKEQLISAYRNQKACRYQVTRDGDAYVVDGNESDLMLFDVNGNVLQ